MIVNYVLGILTLSVVVLSSGGEHVTNCCPHNTLLDPFIQLCTGGEKTLLDCEGHMKILLDPADDDGQAIEIDENGALRFGRIQATPGQYCLVNLTVPRHGSTKKEVKSNEVALACHVQENFRQIFLLFCYLLSLFSLALVLVAHISLSELRDLQGKCHMATVTGLLVGLSSLLVIQTLTNDIGEVMCQLLAFSVYFWLLTAFFWLNVTTFNVWRGAILFHVRFDESHLFLAYSLYAWGVPFALLLFMITMHLLPESYAILRPLFGLNTCWFDDHATQWSYFYGPVAILLSLNCVLFVWTTLYLWTEYTTKCLPMKQRLKKRCLLSIKMFLIMGVGWIFELVSSLDDDDTFLWFVTDVFNILQGVIILIVLILLRRRFWRAVHARRPCGLDAPGWAIKRFLADENNCNRRNMEELKYLQSAETA